MEIDFGERDEHSDQPYKVKIDPVFEGPMDLLVHLIKKNEVDIFDIPIAPITDQFLSYIEMLKTLNIDVAADFIVMAATLAHIKSKMLLPVHREDTETEEDPRWEITRPLLEYIQMKSAAEALGSRKLLGEHTFSRRQTQYETITVAESEFVNIGLFDLIDAFQKVLDKIPPDHRVDLTEERISVKDRITQIVDLLEVNSTITLDELIGLNAGKRDIILTFLAVLEMVRLALVTIAQHVQSGIIRLFYQ
jgi:segregation and condensation protein A